MQRTLAKLCKPNQAISVTILSNEAVKNANYQPSLGYNLNLEPHQIDNAIMRCVDKRDLRTGLLIHSYMLKLHSCGFITLWNKLLSLYIKCEQFHTACHLFDEMPTRNIVSFNTMISAYARHSYFLQALSLYKKLKEDDLKPNHITLSGIIGVCDGLPEKCMMDIFHAQAIRYGLNFNEYVGSSLVNGYANQMKLVDSAKAFTEISHLDLISWNIMIDSCVRNNDKEHSLRIFSRMLHENIEFDEFTLTSVIKMFLGPTDIDNGKMLHCCAMKTGLSHETSVTNSLISMYSKCETGMASARSVFEETMAANIISWTAIISGLMQNGLNTEAISHGGQVDEGIYALSTMISVYKIKPRREHLSCVVDMLGRAGRLSEAEMFIDEMGLDSNVLVWEALLSACRFHGETRLGEKCAKKIIEINPERHGSYVSLSNIYAERGLWEDKRVVLENLPANRLKKEYGCSWMAS
ncbi:pentatricopeptide repeat-containing protein At2g03880, mitochondrial-like [Impatiens glandulifera]|uniref:pentatricopeptide repeat-containing protein At2g03880, mitochondrial-like n=1 Tax=Impatiens glandulifera TaxID=253017 RepID=UPI001FB1656B|nr:pentatricopeptide repeat-containing protein At2g03880, mitochondrial-like [Impatiens glandulifera]